MYEKNVVIQKLFNLIIDRAASKAAKSFPPNKRLSTLQIGGFS
jgi:hypothetical protein